jgi:hypothetical protein
MVALAAARRGGSAAAQAAGLHLPGGAPALQMAGPQTSAAPPPEKQLFKLAEPPQAQEAGGGEAGEGGDEAATAQLMELCMALGYGSAETAAFCAKGDFPEDVVAAYMERVGEADAGKARARLRRQGPRVCALIKHLLAQQQAQKTAQEARVQEVLRAIGKCCMGFDWLREGDGGYRCAGGSHVCSAADIAAAMGTQ